MDKKKRIKGYKWMQEDVIHQALPLSLCCSATDCYNAINKDVIVGAGLYKFEELLGFQKEWMDSPDNEEYGPFWFDVEDVQSRLIVLDLCILLAQDS